MPAPGPPKAEALRQAQLKLLRREGGSGRGPDTDRLRVSIRAGRAVLPHRRQITGIRFTGRLSS